MKPQLSLTRIPRTKFALAAVLAAGLTVPPSLASAEESTDGEDEGPPTHISLSMKQDIFFGFHGITHVSVGLTDELDLTVYGILWTIPAFGAGGGGGNLWTEFGGGVNFNLLDGNLSINPQFGLLSGTLLSGATRGLTFEGIVPNVTITYGDGLIEGQIYAGLYLGVRTLDDSSNNDFLHYWANVGLTITSWISAGAHFESLIQTRGAGSDSEDVYQWLGPYVEARGGPGYVRFSGGVDLTPDDVADFYQISTGVTL